MPKYSPSRLNIRIGLPRTVTNLRFPGSISSTLATTYLDITFQVILKLYNNVPFLGLSATIGNIDFLQEVFHKIHPTKEIAYVEYNKRFINQQRWIWNHGSLCKLHPLCAINEINESFKDVQLSMTPNDCASLWDTIEEEFDEHRKTALEREQKVRRQLQDELNKQKGI